VPQPAAGRSHELVEIKPHNADAQPSAPLHEHVAPALVVDDRCDPAEQLAGG
jgi:hypothetical protein